ncbi:uncharacterized protein LOC125069235 [Vanessa atalanta]|uniref:uncharacterized protein LOC125069235 n=1 Tax=Vanessa atalanta TaxID=42275 RepID=UPI001FCD329B|nr:uncharacterized protein LOC125069235 [Vanessa atalanta]
MKMAQSPRKYGQTGSFSLPTKQTSMCSLIIWNISKALEKNPCMDLRHAMRSAHERFDRESRDEIEMISQTPEERHLTCAILAWQQLGHKDTDSLYQFIEQNRNKPVQQTSENLNNVNIDSVNNTSVSSKSTKDLNLEQPVYSKDIDSKCFDTKSLMGPVVKLPRETKIIMRMESTPCSHHATRKTPKNSKDIINKIDAACCMDSACVQRLADLDTAVCELRNRAAKLARREAERVELLERAEAAWKDLELGYQRRLRLALEKEDDTTKQIKKTIDERNGYKNACTDLAKNVKDLALVAEEDRDKLTLVEKDLCDRACVRLRLSEEAARGDSALAEQLCKAAQMDRDLQFKEDQVRRKVTALDSEIQSARCLTHEAEIALRAELSMLKEQITQVSNQLLAGESEVNQIKLQLEELRTEKEGLLEDLDGCKVMCDNRMLGKVNELKQKREELMQLKEKVIECKCKIPLDEAIEVKRTPSLAALCQCTSEEKQLDTCSCTSIRTQLLSSLLSDLFGGLQSELGGSGSTMPCQLLKCLEDKHNWDRSSVVKSNLRNFFEQLLVGELDIAIATSIEKYHAKWIGRSCADRSQVMSYSMNANDSWQEQNIERRAQKIATKLAEQLFNERADQITKRAKEIMTKGPPPCECQPQSVFQCLVKRPNTTHIARKNTEIPPSYFKRTLQDVTQLKVQVEDLRKESVKKEDLRLMEGKIARIVKRASKQNGIPLTNKKMKRSKDADEKISENTKTSPQNDKTLGQIDNSENRMSYSTKQNINKPNQYGGIENKKKKILKNIEQSFAVNLCLCGTRDNSMQDPPQKDKIQQNISKHKMDTIPSYQISQISPGEDADTQANRFPTQTSCPSRCVCFHKIPSNTSIEKLLETLLNRKGEKNDVSYKAILYNQSKENQTNDNKLSENLRKNIKQNKSSVHLTVHGKDKILLENNIPPTYPSDLVPECYSYKDGHDKGTDYDILPNTTDSEYIGAVNLDKSNDNSFKYTNHNYNKPKYGDGPNICMKTSEVIKSDQTHKIQPPNSCKLDFKKESQVYSVQASSKFKNVDKELPNINTNKEIKNLDECRNSYVGDVLKKSDLLSDDCDYYVKFLGVTLTNVFKTAKESDENNTISTFTNLSKDSPNTLEVKPRSQTYLKNQTNSELQYSPIKRDSNLSNILCNDKNKILINTPNIINDDQTKCVCCNKDEYKDLELNAFNLLEEHLREKLVEFQRYSYKSGRITAEEEKVLFSNILTKVKEVVSENTNRLSCKCMGLNVNEESWKRAYSLLQEYLKVKMKRAQCSCITNDSSIENSLPVILDKVSNLIDNDFQRLRDKCKCINEKSFGNVLLKNSKEQMTESILQYNDTVVQFNTSKTSNQHANNLEDTSVQALSILVDNKSCEACEYNNLKKNNTAEKKVSCEFQRGYIIDCKCRYTFSEPCYLDFNATAKANQSITNNIKFKCNKLQAMEISNNTPASISSNLVKEQLKLPKRKVTKIADPICTQQCSGNKSNCSCVRLVDICHCNKSTMETNYEKDDRISKSLQENPSNNLFYIMHRIPAPISEHLYINKSIGSHCEQKDLTSSCDVETITADNEEEIILKYSKETCCVTDTSNNTSLSNVTKHKKDSSNWYDCNARQIDDNEYDETDYELNKNSLYDSLYLPTDQNSQYKKYKDVKDSNVKDPGICNCKVVPICHVKMLVESIEQKLVQSKCICDSLSSRVCPIHAKEEFYMDSVKNTVKMEEKPGEVKKRNKPNIVSRLFICWICPVLFKGNKRDIEENDLIIPSKQYDSDRLGGRLERYWLEEYDRALRENRKPSLWKAFIKAYWLAYLPGACLLLINATARTVQPLLFSELLSYWSANASQSITRQEAGFYAIGMLALNLVGALSQHHNSLFVTRFSLKMKVACSSLIYRKILRMNQVSISEVAAGKLVNILSNDVARFDMAFMFLHYLWLVPVQLAIVLYFLYGAGGYAPYVGLFGVVLLVLPIQAGLTKLTAIIRRNVAQRTDKRIKLMSEIINGIQVIKMYAWEKSFQHVVKVARAFELAALKKSIFVRSVFLGFMMFAERSTLFLTALTFILSGNLLRADTIYPIKVFLGIVQMNLTFILPLAIASLSELKVSLGRIQNVLIMDEREDLSLLKKPTASIVPVDFNGKMTTIDSNSIVARKYSSKENFRPSIVSPRTSVVGETLVELSGVSASWDASKSPEDMTLKNITMHLRKGKLCAIIGAVGSGKSSLLQVLLRELPVNSGNLTIKGSMSYACQESWLFPATVRENILFGLPYDVNRYNEVCRVCSLLPDFKQFPYGDLSLVGERGVSLSGGQRARINLARAVYREADIYLLDDPLSAVDAKVGRQLFEGCIQKYLRGRTRILVTHQVHFLKAADFIIVLNEGSIKNMGSYDDLVKSEIEFSSLVSDDKENKVEADIQEDERRPVLQRGMSRMSVRSDDKDTREEKEQVLIAEERAKGNLKWAVIQNYLSSVKSWLIVFMAVFSLLLTQTGATFSDYWLSYWTNQVDEYEQSLPPGEEPDTSLGTQVGPLTTGLYLWIYGGAVLFIIIMTHVRITAFVVMAMRASQNLHDTMFKNLLTAVMRFFDTNPSGRVLNRFSKDMGAMDELLPRSMLETIQMYLFVTSVLVLNALALPWTLIPTAVLLFIFVILLKWYLNAAQAVKRLESTTKSPVFSMINSTISGLSTVRSSNSQYRLLKMFDDAQDLNSSALYTLLGGSSAFGLFLDLLCLVYLGVILAVFILIDFGSLIAVGSVGLAVSQSMTLTMMLQMSARVTADLLGHMTSVERVLEYSKLPAEENMEDGPTQAPPNWPSDGQIQFENVSLKYGAEDPPVLKDLNFTINSGWKVGIVGRTGAGKSSLMAALFRLSNIEGSIKIDGIDTCGISKKDLRSKISVIPQEPVLFSATLRYNLDPFNLYSDDEIWKALEQVELKDAVQALDFHVTEGGTNFSVGQRQLVCLARAVLRNNKILVMDEATANVDPQTDVLIQKTIRRQFASCTVLTIAHRLHTVMDSDRVLVMDKGRVAEFDHPYILLSNPNSLLNYMVKETGEGMSNVLYETAKAKYQTEVS